MKIIRIHIDGFGKLHNFEITPGSGMTVLYGRNEAGKSTLHLFIRAIFYGVSVKRRLGMKSDYDRMRPWRDPEVYRGRMEVESGQQRYLIERDFSKAPDDLKVCRLEGGKAVPVEDPQGFMKELLHGLSETAYVNTVSAGQLETATHKELAADLRRYLKNVSGSMHPDIDPDRALGMLKEKKAELSAGMDPEAQKRYNRVLAEIRRLEQRLSLPENENQILHYTQEVERVRREEAELADKAEECAARTEKYQKELGRLGFENEAHVRTASVQAEEDWQELAAQRRQAASRGPVIGAAVFFIAAAVMGVLAAMAAGILHAASALGGVIASAGITGPNTVLAGIFAAAAVLLAAGGIFLLSRRAFVRKRCDEIAARFAGGTAPYTGTAEANEETLGKFREKIEYARYTAQRINETKREAEELSAERLGLGREQAKYLQDLEEQRRTKDKVETGLVRVRELQRQAAALRRQIRENKRLQEELDAVEMAEETIRGLSADIRGAAGTYINKTASEMLSSITDQAYTSVSAGVNYDIRLNSEDGMIPVSEVSRGTADQVYLAIRLATVRFLTGETDPMPLILDDSFTLYDDARLRAALSFLAGVCTGQVLIFSCQDREQKILEELGCEFTLAELENGVQA